MKFCRAFPVSVSVGLFLLFLCSAAFAEAFQVDRWGVLDARFPGRRVAEDFAIMQYPLILSSRPDKRPVNVFFECRGDLFFKRPQGSKPPVTAVFNGKPIVPELRYGKSDSVQWVRVIVRLPDRDMKYAEKGALNELKLTFNGSDGTTVEKSLTIPGLTLTTTDSASSTGRWRIATASPTRWR